MTPEDAERSREPPPWRLWLARATVGLMPLSINLERILGTMKRPWYLSPLDLLLPVLFILMLVDLIQRRPWARFKAPPLPALIWVGLALLSCAWIAGFPQGDTLKEWALGTANPLVVVVIPCWVFLNVSTDPAEYRRLALILGGSFGLCVLIALYQYVRPVGLPFDTANRTRELGGVSNIRLGGWYDYRALFGAQAAMLVPAAAAFTLLETGTAVRLASGALAALALSVTLAAGGFMGACAGLIAVTAVYIMQRGEWRRPLAALAFYLLFALHPGFSGAAARDKPAVLLRGLALYAQIPGQEKKKPTARLRRYQAALDLLGAPSDPRNEQSRPNWIAGVGAGRYREETNRFYQPPYDKPSASGDDEAQFDMEADERFTFGLLETIGVELGLPGLLVIFFFFACWTTSALASFPTRPSPPQDVLALAAFGAGCGALVLSVFANPVLRGAGPGGTFAFFFALAWCGRRFTPASLQQTSD